MSIALGPIDRLTFNLRQAWRRLFPPTTYVVIYDQEIEPGSDEFTEEYYGYFSTPQEAIDMYHTMIRGQPGYTNAKLCKAICDIPPIEEDL